MGPSQSALVSSSSMVCGTTSIGMQLAVLLAVLCFGNSFELNPCVLKFDSTSYGVGVYNETFTNASYCTYLGVRYAEAPVGPLRFKNPVPYIPNGPQNYSAVGSICPQENDVNKPTEIIGDEDCLFMNIYSPLSSRNQSEHTEHQFPVLVFVHGGSFMAGSALTDVDNGVDLLIDSGVLVVSINYRLYALGFLRHTAFNITGNFGLKDQRAALQWIQKYIKFFGGDPSRVTLMGQSAGAGSATYHLYAESSRGLFHQLFALGGSMLGPWAQKYAPPDITYDARFDVDTIEELQEIDFKQFFFKNNFDTFGFVSMLYPGFIPTVEDPNDPEAFLTTTPHEMILQKPGSLVPIMIEHTATEFESLLYYCNFFYLGNNFPNNQNQSISNNIKTMVKLKYHLVQDPNFFKKLANTANLLYPIKRLLKHLLQHMDTTPIYYLRFEFDGQFGFYKNEFYKTRTNGSRYGAVHGDELGYIFSPYVMKEALVNKTQFRQEWKIHERTVELVTNFVKYGNPTPKRSKQSNVLWPAYNENLNHPEFLNIDDTFEIREDNDSDDEYIRFYEPIYECLYYFECGLLETTLAELIAVGEQHNVQEADESENFIIDDDE